ncbi:hypothetical protein [Salinicola corii]|uniref:hypothetical protein n=1 Tax=Salinicola corii TaxID=2606937 RepID=UPI0016591BE6|nr:hypothetical protein [Salinicola corii]
MELEENIEKAYSSIYDQPDESSSINKKNITLYSNPSFSIGSSDIECEKEKFAAYATLNLLSYAIGCMFGRYSLNSDSLVGLRKGGDSTTNPFRLYKVDENGIIPFTDQEWFSDDATNRFRDFVRIVWGEEHLQENLEFVAESLCLHAIKPKKGEAPLETIRRYLSSQFYKDHRMRPPSTTAPTCCWD